MSGRHWTVDELDLVREIYGSVPVEVLAAQLGRSAAAVRVRASKLHLGRQRPAGVMSMNELMQVLGMDAHNTMRRWIDKRWLRARRSPRYGRHDRLEWWIEERDLVAFLREHAHLVDRACVDRAYRQFVPDRWITLVEAFKRGAAWPMFLENAAKAGLLPEVRNRGDKGTRWAVPERTLPVLVEARRRMTTDADHRRLLLMYEQAEHAGRVRMRVVAHNAAARALAAGGRSGTFKGRGRAAA